MDTDNAQIMEGGPRSICSTASGVLQVVIKTDYHDDDDEDK